MQPFAFSSGHSSQSESATEMQNLEKRRKKKSGRRPNAAQNDDGDDMDDANLISQNVASTDFGALSPLQKRHRIRSFERIEVGGFNEAGYLSDSSLPSVRQSLARHYERDINESTPLLSRQHSTTELEQTEQSLVDDDDDDDKDVTVVQTPQGRRRHMIKKYGKQIKIAILFVITLASVVRHSVGVNSHPLYIYFPTTDYVC